jgi:amino-acid racemase
VALPPLHIADATAERVKAAGHRTLGLLATRFTMEDEFYRGRLREQHGLEVLVPGADDRLMVHRIIYEELCRGQVLDASRRQYQAIIRGLARDGAEAVILACTEITLLIGPPDADVPLYDTTRIHAEEAARLALG